MLLSILFIIKYFFNFTIPIELPFLLNLDNFSLCPRVYICLCLCRCDSIVIWFRFSATIAYDLHVLNAEEADGQARADRGRDWSVGERARAREQAERVGNMLCAACCWDHK